MFTFLHKERSAARAAALPERDSLSVSKGVEAQQLQALTEVNNTLQTLQTGRCSHQQLPEINTKDPTYTHQLSCSRRLPDSSAPVQDPITYIGNTGKCSFQLFNFFCQKF